MENILSKKKKKKKECMYKKNIYFKYGPVVKISLKPSDL